MSDQDILTRFEELEAGRILGDLDAEETAEWKKLSEDPRCQPDVSLEFVAAAIETEYLQAQSADLPDDVVKNLHKDMAEFTSEDLIEDSENLTEEKVVRPAMWQTVLKSPQTAWSIAALFIVLFVAQVLQKPATPDPSPGQIVVVQPAKVTAEEALAKLKDTADDLVVSKFGGQKGYEDMSGQVTWSDTLQEGYMTLTRLRTNDPKEKQYQLWIVDPSRDEKPVDGGVFDIPADQDTVVIPIRNPLIVMNPKAFVITLEQAGGVVVSKQKEVVAIAANS